MKHLASISILIKALFISLTLVLIKKLVVENLYFNDQIISELIELSDITILIV